MLRNVDAGETHRLLDYPGLIDALDGMYKTGVDAVTRLVLNETLPGQKQNDWLILPAWQYGRNFGVKLVSVFPGNAERGLASILGIYALFDGETGMPLAVIDGAALTLRKTAANSALAVRYLARKDVRRMAMLGAGALAPHLVMAHCSVRPSIEHLTIWNRSRDKAVAMAERLRTEPATRHLTIAIADTAEAAIREADIVSASIWSARSARTCARPTTGLSPARGSSAMHASRRLPNAAIFAIRSRAASSPTATLPTCSSSRAANARPADRPARSPSSSRAAAATKISRPRNISCRRPIPSRNRLRPEAAPDRRRPHCGRAPRDGCARARSL
jgi:hypothetical protein